MERGLIVKVCLFHEKKKKKMGQNFFLVIFFFDMYLYNGTLSAKTAGIDKYIIKAFTAKYRSDWTIEGDNSRYIYKSTSGSVKERKGLLFSLLLMLLLLVISVVSLLLGAVMGEGGGEGKESEEGVWREGEEREREE